MSIQKDKLMNLADGKVLYDDLRGKIDDTASEMESAVSSLGERISEEAVPYGGSTGQVLTKKSNAFYDMEWATPPSPPVRDVQVSGISVVSASGYAEIPTATKDTRGVVKADSASLTVGNGIMSVQDSDETFYKGGDTPRAVCCSSQHKAAFFGLAKAAGADMASITSTTVGQYPEAQKSAISTMLNSPVSVSGSTPAITALPGIQYVCGEVSTLDITLPASGCVDVVFESGSTPTVLTITPPSGVTVKWANGFDPTSLEANTTYEINIKDGLGVAGSWT